MLFAMLATGAFAQPSAKAPRKDSASRAENADPLPSFPESLVRKQEAQQRVRLMARDLVSAILDIQLVQLDENDLTSTDLYRDIRAMRGHIDELIEAEMPRVVDLLVQIQGAGDDRDKKFVAARQKSREILVQLLVERQRVLRRLRIAELAAQVRQLIQTQTKVQGVTQSLPEQAPTQRDALALSAVEDQRDVKAVYLRLHETIKDVATWGGEVGTLASNAVQMLQKSQIEAEMDGAAKNLEQTKYADAVTNQENVLKALRELLQILERVQGLMKGDQHAMEKAIQDLVDRQAEIRQATNQSDASERDLQQLTQQQSQVQKDMAELGRQPQAAAEAAKPLEEAKQAAEEATAKLFEGNPKEAVPQQDKVLENLNKATQAMENPAKPENKPNEPERMAQATADLEAARKDLEKIQQEQKQASATAVNKPAEARPQENQIARELTEVPKNRNLPEQVTSRVHEAQQAAAEAATAMDHPEPQRHEATRTAEQAIQRALSEVEQALADAKRQQLRDAMNAMAQAAQSVEQAAAAEREVAHQAQEASQKSGLEASQAHDLVQKQAEVQKTAADVSKHVEKAAPEASKTLAAAAQPIQQAAEKLQAAEQQPGEPSKPPAQQAASQAQQAAEKLSQAAQQLDKEAAQAAERLAQLTSQQLQQAQQALQAVEQAVAKRPESLGQRMEKLAQAEEHVKKAEAEQQRAAGRPEAAKAAEHVAELEKALAKQPREEARKPLEEALKAAKAEAAKAAEAPAGKSDAQAQAHVGQEIEAAKELAAPDAPKAAETLSEAGKSSDEAQQQSPPAGSPEKAAKAQESTAQGLEKAAEQLAEAKRELAQKAAEQMAKEVPAAQQLADKAAPVDPGATGALQSAENQARQATQEVPKLPDLAPKAEQGVAEAMDRAAADLAARVEQLKGDQDMAQAVAEQAAQPPPGAGSTHEPKPSDQASPRPTDGGSARKGKLVQNQKASPRPVDTAKRNPQGDNRGTVTPGDAEAARHREMEEAWFAKLPPEVRAAIRANSQRRPPRGYEERLQRYFKNLD